MNILVVAFHQVYPLETGASVSQFSIIEHLSDRCNISLLLPDRVTITEQNFNELQRLLPRVKVYIADNQYKVNNERANIKIYNSLRLLKDKARIFVKSLLKGNEVVQEHLSEKAFEDILWNPYYLHSVKFVETINQIIVQDKIDIVQLEFVENLNLVTFIPPYIKKVFVEHECIFKRIESHMIAKRMKSVFADYVLNFYKSIELSLLEQVDGIVTFSHSETEILQNALGDKKNKIEFSLSPFPILERDFREVSIENFPKLDKLTFVGGEHHFPNKDAVEWFLEEAAVDIFQKFGLRLYVVGKWRSETIKKYNNHPSGVQFVGYIEDLYEFTRGSISVAPVRIGGGLKTKIMLAMAQGIPVISTKFAVDGIHAKHSESVMIADEKGAFCSAIEYLLADLERTAKICINAQNLIKQGYSQSVVSEQRYNFYQKLLSV
jgi:glycosyltransferase involved in cell wall biosynthesis